MLVDQQNNPSQPGVQRPASVSLEGSEISLSTLYCINTIRYMVITSTVKASGI